MYCVWLRMERGGYLDQKRKTNNINQKITYLRPEENTVRRCDKGYADC